MFRYSSLFRSRWLALIWSAGVLWGAVNVAGFDTADEDVNASDAAGDGVTDLNQIQALAGKLRAL